MSPVLTFPKSPVGMAFRTAAKVAVDLVYPPSCALCSARLHVAEDKICDPCRIEMLTEWAWRCPLCGATGEGIPPRGGLPCPLCPEPGDPFHGRLAAIHYGPRSAQCVHLFKYGRRQDMGDLIADIMIARLAEPILSLEERVSWVVPVPLHWTRRTSRGFNQSERLAAVLAKAVGLSYRRDVLRRIRRTKMQVRLPRGQREENVAGAFVVRPGAGASLPGILLVDDVITTGSTVRECARVLSEAGAEQVWIATFAQA